MWLRQETWENERWTAVKSELASVSHLPVTHSWFLKTPTGHSPEVFSPRHPWRATGGWTSALWLCWTYKQLKTCKVIFMTLGKHIGLEDFSSRSDSSFDPKPCGTNSRHTHGSLQCSDAAKKTWAKGRNPSILRFFIKFCCWFLNRKTSGRNILTWWWR